MNKLERRSNGRMTRHRREQRIYRLIVVGGLSGALGAIGLVLAIVGVLGAGIPILLLVLAVVCGLLIRRTLRP